VLLEAMAAGAPVVASDLTGYRHVARDGIEALLVPPDDPDALRAALRRVLDEPEPRRAMIQAGRARADHFSLDRLAERFLDCYERAMARRAPTPVPA
jgi:glycosyltransferase involved in cell wall biosynthesis